MYVVHNNKGASAEMGMSSRDNSRTTQTGRRYNKHHLRVAARLHCIYASLPRRYRYLRDQEIEVS